MPRQIRDFYPGGTSPEHLYASPMCKGCHFNREYAVKDHGEVAHYRYCSVINKIELALLDVGPVPAQLQLEEVTRVDLFTQVEHVTTVVTCRRRAEKGSRPRKRRIRRTRVIPGQLALFEVLPCH